MDQGYERRGDDVAKDRNPERIAGAASALGSVVAADPWKHRSEGMRCRTCMWFALKLPIGPLSTERQSQIGRCRRHAPTMGGYPVVFMTDWCGDHRLDENRA